jgi:hypothetical protein
VDPPVQDTTHVVAVMVDVTLWVRVVIVEVVDVNVTKVDVVPVAVIIVELV